MKKATLLVSVVLLAVAITAGIASAQTTFNATLTGLAENPPNASPATGFGTVVRAIEVDVAVTGQDWLEQTWQPPMRMGLNRVLHGPCF